MNILHERAKNQAQPRLTQKNPHISASKQKFKNLIGYFLGIKLASPHAKFQLASFQTEGGV